MTSKLLAFAGSTRQGSWNRLLAAAAADAAREAGAEVTLLELRDYPLPLYNGDLEAEGLPSRLETLAELFRAHDGLLIAAPEYNSGYTPLLKNTLDWLTRVPVPADGRAPLRSKTAALLSASPGALGGLRGLYQLRDVLQNIGVTVLPDPHLLAIGGAPQAFDADGKLVDARRRESLDALVRALTRAVTQAARR